MIPPQKPPNEEERLIALRRLNILDTAPEARFDRVTRLAARLFCVPHAMVSLVDEKRQWFKSRHALEIEETPREESICAYAILQEEPLVIPDTSKDPRFHGHPRVCGGVGVRFYAGCPLRTSSGHPVGTLCIFDTKPREFTEEQVADLKELAAIVEGELEAVILDEALLLTSSLQRAFLDSMDACIIATDLDGQILRVNSAGERMLGYTSAELTDGETLLRIVEPEELGRRTAALMDSTGGAVQDAFQALLHRGANVTAPERSWTYVRKDGSEFPVRLSIIPLQTDAGVPTGYLTVARDITREKEVEQTMLAAKDAAEHASETKSRFLANMSHEIRTPLNGILGVNTMLLEGELSPEQVRLAGIVQESAESLLNIVDDILDFSKVEAGLIELEERPFSLSSLLSMVQRLHSVRASARGLVIETRIGPDVPDWLIGDGSRVRQVVNNFVSNATKFSERGKITISATAESFDNKGRVWLRICVQDFGIGVPPHARQRIFEAFAQADGSTTRRYGGTGLGLSICKQLVQLMGGEIGVESESGEGSTFWFTVRLRISTVEKEPEIDNPMEKMRIPGLRVLVAEDSNVNQMVILHELRRLGCKAEVVNNGLEALRAVERRQFDLVLMDCQMPVMDGYEAAAEIRKLPGVSADLPIVAITANAMVGEQERCRECGMGGYLRKPFSRTQFREVLMEALPSGFIVGLDDEEPALGTEELEALQSEAEEMGCELLQRLAEAFSAEADEALAHLEAARLSLDCGRMFEAAHKLKGSCSNFGARPLRRVCESLERHAQDGACDEAIALIPELRDEVRRVNESLAAIIIRAPALSIYP